MENNKALQSLTALFDENRFTEIDPFVKKDDEENAYCGCGEIGGVKAYAFILNGALDLSKCEKIKKTYSLAQTTGAPVVGIYSSNGLKLTEGFDLINAYGELTKLSSRLSGVVPQISIIDGVCLGVAAVMANSADLVVAVKDSDFYVSPPSDVTIEENAKNGVVDLTADDFESAASKVADIISLLPSNNLSPLANFEFDGTQGTGEDIVSVLSDNQISVEFKSEYAKEVKTVLTTIGGNVSGIIDFDGALTPSGAYKAESFVKLCDAYNIPIVTVADSDGIDGENETQSLVAVSKLVSAYASATSAKISLISKEASAGAYVVLAGKTSNADIVYALDGASVSAMKPESAVAFLWNDRLAKGEDRKALEDEYKTTIGSALEAAKAGAVDDVFSKDLVKEKIVNALDILSSKRETTIPRKHTVK